SCARPAGTRRASRPTGCTRRSAPAPPASWIMTAAPHRSGPTDERDRGHPRRRGSRLPPLRREAPRRLAEGRAARGGRWPRGRAVQLRPVQPDVPAAPEQRRIRAAQQPPGELLPSAHAIDREYRVQKALSGTGFPVATPILYCEDRDVIGTPFYLMERMVGRVFTDSALPGVEPADRGAMYRSAAETLARLHTVDVDAVGLSDFGRPGNYYERRFNRWSRTDLQTKTQEIPEMDRLMAWLPELMPAGDETSIVHGGYRIGNLMFHPSEPRVIAVFGWELSTLGHP